MFKNVLIVFLGGGLGSVFRFLISHFFSKNSGFPLATFLVNIVGCFLIGILFGYFQKNNENEMLKNLLVAGFCGGLTTFSTFSLENFNFYQTSQFKLLFLYTFLSIFAGLFALWIGFKINKI